MTQNEQTNRMRWASRRGLLELDLLLGPFMDACFAELEPSLRDDYQQLMGHEDQDILNWILGRETLVDESLVAITDKIRALWRYQNRVAGIGTDLRIVSVEMKPSRFTSGCGTADGQRGDLSEISQLK